MVELNKTKLAEFRERERERERVNAARGIFSFLNFLIKSPILE